MARIAVLTTEMTEDGPAAPLGSGGILPPTTGSRKLSELKVIFCCMSGDVVSKSMFTEDKVVCWVARLVTST
jgi:hypothetical protein